nr:uncharacterized protein LOC111105920 isoform X2 [Crassostrea virginica]XP_022296111.1 uncharacterized protein LOC111105920 isoform X2 [Crassostrea virginica]
MPKHDMTSVSFVSLADKKQGSIHEIACHIHKISVAVMYAIRYIVVMFTLTWYSAADYMGEFCLEKSVAFIDYNYKCSFTKQDVKAFFNRDNIMYQCKHNCSVEIHDEWNLDLKNSFVYRVNELQLTIDGLTLTHKDCQYWYTSWKATFKIICASWTHDTCILICPPGYFNVNGHCLLDNVVVGMACTLKEQCKGTEHSGVCSKGTCACKKGYIFIDQLCYEDNVVVGGACTLKEQCKGTEHSGVCSNGTCACEKGYISIDQHCYEGNVSLDNQCLYHAQCSGSPNASCRDGNCSCIEGYVPDKSSKCILRLESNDKETFIGDQRESSLGSTLGALLGGVLLGVLITTVIGFIFYKRSQQNYIKRQTEEPTVVFADNHAYGTARIQGNTDNASTNNKNNQRQIVNVSPYTPSDESPEYGNVSQTSRTKRANENIYNHLNEKETPDDDDNYDHACAATGHTRGNFDSEYSSMRDVDKDYGTSVAKRADEYFTLEQN